jgi:hypothetical protein
VGGQASVTGPSIVSYTAGTPRSAKNQNFTEKEKSTAFSVQLYLQMLYYSPVRPTTTSVRCGALFYTLTVALF